MINKKIGFIGAGNMAQAIALGLIDSGAIDPKNITASAPSMKNLKRFKDAGTNVTHNNTEVIINSDIVFLAMKPQYLDAAIDSFEKIPYDGKVYVSILVGVKLETLEKKFQIRSSNDQHYKIIRVLPNTPILVGAGCSVMAANAHTTEEEVALVKSIMSIGGSCDLIQENLINPCSAVCGSGPAFVSLDVNFNLESNNDNKCFPPENAPPCNSEKLNSSGVSSIKIKKESLLTTVEPVVEYREKEDISSECADSESNSADTSDNDSPEISSIILGKNENEESTKTRMIYSKNIRKMGKLRRLKLSRYNRSLEEKGWNRYVGHKTSSKNFPSLNIKDSESRVFVDKNEYYFRDQELYDLRFHNSRKRGYGSRYLKILSDQRDCFTDRGRNHEVEGHRCRYSPISSSDYCLEKSWLIPYPRKDYSVNEPTSYPRISSAFHSYNSYYQRNESLTTGQASERTCYNPYWNMECRSGVPKYWEQSFSDQDPTYYFGKRKITDTDCIFNQPTVKKCRQNPALHPLQVVIIRFNQDPISQFMAARLRFKLILMVNASFGSGFSPKFETTHLLRNGQFLVCCSDEPTVNWLMGQKLTEEDGTPFVMMKITELPLMQMVNAFIPYNSQPVKEVLECLAFQNPGLRTDKWLVGKRFMSRGGQHLELFINEESCKYLDTLNWKPHFQLCRVNFKKVYSHEQEICRLCKSFAKICTLCSS